MYQTVTTEKPLEDANKKINYIHGKPFTNDNKLASSVNPFHATDLFWYLLKTSEKLWFRKPSGGIKKN